MKLHEQRHLFLALGLLGRVDLLLIHEQHVLRHCTSDVPGLRRPTRLYHYVAAGRAIWTVGV